MPICRLVSSAALAACLLVLPLAATAAEPPQVPGVKMEEAWPDVEFNQPLGIVNAGDGSDRLFVIEKPGRVIMLPKWRGVGPVARPSTFLDIRDMCVDKAQGGLLSLAFHPKFKQNGRAFISYLATHSNAATPALKFKLVIAEMRVQGDKADKSSIRPILQIVKKFPVHHAGHIKFGPDSMLYIGTGDGGSKNDKDGNAQNPRSLLGKILRIDVDNTTGSSRYSIPKGNPWPNLRDPQDPTKWRVRPEIWGFGMRNPWQFSWDAQGRMWTTEPGTTGPESREWVIQITRAGNHGWPYYEGTRSLKPLPPSVNASSLIKPAFEWLRGEGSGGTAGVGGFVYAGARVPALRGKYLFGDYMKGRIYSIDLTGGQRGVKGSNHRTVGDVPDMSAIGVDEQGELYFCAYEAGMVFTLAPK